MKNFSFYGRKAPVYPFIFGMYLFFAPALARAAVGTNAPFATPTAASSTLTNPQTTLAVHHRTPAAPQNPVPRTQNPAPKSQNPTDKSQNPITGTVTDATGILPGVTITIKGTPKATTTDARGHYQIEAGPTDTLVFSFVGYKTTEQKVGERGTIDVLLPEDVTSLQEVTVNAGYYKVKDKERTGSIARITSSDIEKQPVTSFLATMQGRMAGVNITQSTGTPGGGFEIQIRGQNSLRNDGNSPLYIIDGVPYASDPIGPGYNAAVVPGQQSPLNSLAPDQIESIEVLKDADATAIYGSRGANGVVLVTTKKGKAGKTRFNATVAQGVGSVTRFMHLLNTRQYLALREEALANDGASPIPDYAYDVNGTWDRNRYTDWQRELIGGTAEFTRVNANVSGGSAQTQFLFAGSYSKQTTVTPGNFAYQKGSFHLNVNHESENKKFHSNVSVSYTVQDNRQPDVDLFRDALTLPPNAPALYTPDGALNWENNTFSNPAAKLEGKYHSVINDLVATALLSCDLAAGLQLRSSFGFTKTDNGELTGSPSTIYNPAYGIGPEYAALYQSATGRKSWSIEPQLNYTKTFGKGKLDVLAGSSFQSQKGNQLVQYGFGFSSNSLLYNLSSAGTVLTLNSEATEYKYQAFFGRVNFNWNEKYIMNLTGRRDGSSRFGPGRQFANFGAVGVAWLFSRENLLKDNTVLSFGKLRASYGITGNDQIGDYQYLDTYGSSGNTYNGTIGLAPSRLYNPNFGWESNRKAEVALEMGFLKDRIFLTAAGYRNRSSNQLAGIPLPGTTGFTSIQANLDATVQNTGLELTLRTENIKQKDFGWTTTINLTTSKNKLVSFPGLAASTYASQYVIGQPLDILKLYHYTGVDPQTGAYTYADANGDGMLGAADKTSIRHLGPKYFGGVQNAIRYKAWTLDFLFQFVKQQNYNASAYFGLPGTYGNQTTEVLSHWQQPGESAETAVPTDGANGAAAEGFYRSFESDRQISDASFVRLKTLSISYDVPVQGLQMRLFAEGQNVLTFTRFNGADPEFRSVGYLPPLRMLSAGIQIGF